MTSMTINGADKEREHPPASLRVLRFVVGLLLFLVAPAWCGIAYWANTHAVQKHSDSVTPVVEIYDETGTIRDIGGRPLSAVLEDVRFSRAVHLVVLSSNSLSGGSMDQAVVTYARQSSGVAERGWIDVGKRIRDSGCVAR